MIHMCDDKSLLKVGVLGCGPISQFAHFESCKKARNIILFGICDAAEDLLEKMNRRWNPITSYTDFDVMLEDPDIEAVIIATSDPFHIPLTLKAVKAGKHVLVEKPLSHSIEECQQLHQAVSDNRVHVQVGHMKRFDPGIEFAHRFATERMGKLIALKAWYGDHLQRYTETDNLQPIPEKSFRSIKPGKNVKENLQRYYMMAHGSHLLDTAVLFGGRIGSVYAQFTQKYDIFCWFISVEFLNGAVGHLDLTIKIRLDWHEGFQMYGQYGSILAKTYNPWYYKSSEVSCYFEPEQQYYKPLGADGFSYRRQLEHFADVILTDAPPKGTSINEGQHVVESMIAIHESVIKQKKIYLDKLSFSAL